MFFHLNQPLFYIQIIRNTLYERGGLFDDLVELLRERAILEKQTDAKIELLRRLARVLGQHMSDSAAELDAWYHEPET